MRADIKLIREELECLKGWIKHWKVDVECKLVPTDSSLIFAEHHADRALSLLDRVICINGYDQPDNCEHCGKHLIHGVVTNTP